MKSRKSNSTVKAYAACHSRLTKKGFTAKTVQLDNEISKDLIKAIGLHLLVTREARQALQAGANRLRPLQMKAIDSAPTTFNPHPIKETVNVPHHSPAVPHLHRISAQEVDDIATNAALAQGRRGPLAVVRATEANLHS